MLFHFFTAASLYVEGLFDAATWGAQQHRFRRKSWKPGLSPGFGEARSDTTLKAIVHSDADRSLVKKLSVAAEQRKSGAMWFPSQEFPKIVR